MILLTPARCLVIVILIAAALILACSASRKIRHTDPSTWPSPAPDYVKSFSIERYQREIGFSLKKRQVLFERACWNWTAKGLTGAIWVSVSSTARAAREALFSGSGRLPSISPKLLGPDGVMIGDVSWLSATRGRHLWFCRRNVAVWMEVAQRGKDPQDELIRLSKAVVKAIDSEELVTKPDLVECPVAEVDAPEQLKVGESATISVVARRPEGAQLTYTCLPTNARYMRSPGRFFRSTATGKVRFDLEAMEAGDAVVILDVTDDQGMTTRTVKIIRIVGDPTKPPGVRCPECRSKVPANSEGCPHCGVSLKKK